MCTSILTWTSKGGQKMADFNKVILLGRLTDDPDLRYTSSGMAVCNVSLAVNRKYKSSDGEPKEETLFQRITIWGKMGETISTYAEKGQQMLFEGRLKSGSYEAEDGTTRYTTDVVADKFQFISSGKPKDGEESPASKKTSSKKAPKKAPKKKAPVDEDDIPF